MKSPLKDIKDLVSVGGEAIDRNSESGEERQEALSKRHEVDMQSDNKLSKSIRPITLVWLLSIETLIIVLEACGLSIDTDTKIQVGVLLGAAFGFYFNSKRHERVAQKNAEANIKMEMLRTKADLKADRRRARRER